MLTGKTAGMRYYSGSLLDLVVPRLQCDRRICTIYNKILIFN